MPTRKGHAVWRGDLKNGSGTLGTETDLLNEVPYSYPSRFQQGTGTNPEELLAAAHAACFTMAFSNILAGAGHEPTRVSTQAHVTLSTEGGAHISSIELHCEAEVPGIDVATFQRCAEEAKGGCPLSKALAAVDIQLEAKLSN
jgi:osmotically inducible protein OsmC